MMQVAEKQDNSYLPKVLNLFTASYPYGWGESYLESELEILKDHFDLIKIYPLSKKGELLRKLPENIQIIDVSSAANHSGLSFMDEFRIAGIMFREAFSCHKPIAFFRYWRSMRAVLKRSVALARALQNTQLNPNEFYYSFWMNEWALSLALLRSKGNISGFFFRVNGFDIYDERGKWGFRPFRHFIYRHTDKIFTVSDEAKKYITEKYGNRNKVETAHFGTNDFGFFIPEKNKTFRIMSCSRVIPLKNCLQIARVIGSLNFPVEWHHHGDGEELEKLLKIVNDFPSNIKFTNTAFVDDHFQAIKLQLEFQPDMFISLSTTEGLPVTLINAISMGIPIVATDVGGCREVITPTTGILLSSAPSDTEVANAIRRIYSEDWSFESKRRTIRQFWENEFSAAARYKDFADKIMHLKQDSNKK